MQPGPRHGGDGSRDVIARLSAFVPLRARDVNFVDCAVAELDEDIEVDELIDGTVRLAGVEHDLEEGMQVSKLGCSSGLTHGVIEATNLVGVDVRHGRAVLQFDDVIEIIGDERMFSEAGDSGAVVYTPTGMACALLMAGSAMPAFPGSYASPLTRVLSELDVQLLVQS